MSNIFIDNLHQLRSEGICVLKGVFDDSSIQKARAQILNNRHFFKNTRPTSSSGHLAGFHRFPALESLHTTLTCNPIINSFIELI